MAKADENFVRTMQFAEKALEKMRVHQTPAYPRVYEFWYTLASGENAALSQAVEAHLSRLAGITESDIDQFYDSYLSPLRFADRVDEVGARLVGEIDQVMAMVDAAMGQATTYGDELRITHRRLLDDGGDREMVKTLVESLVRMTREMEISNKILEGRLLESRNEISALQDDLNAVRTESLTDPLTSLSNRKAFDGTLATSLRAAQTTGEPMALLITDIDHFKRFNDSYGHLTGDQVLRLVAMAMKQNVRGADLAARYGGEEFGVILPNTPLRSAITVAEHIRRAVMSKELVKRSTGENLGRITISVGVATSRANDTPTSLIARADNCLYAAKRAGRNRVVSENDPEFEVNAVMA